MQMQISGEYKSVAFLTSSRRPAPHPFSLSFIFVRGGAPLPITSPQLVSAAGPQYSPHHQNINTTPHWRRHTHTRTKVSLRARGLWHAAQEQTETNKARSTHYHHSSSNWLPAQRPPGSPLQCCCHHIHDTHDEIQNWKRRI